MIVPATNLERPLIPFMKTLMKYLIPWLGIALFAHAERPPNVIFILADDQGWADIGYNNKNVYTPNLDALAEGGAIFRNYYVTPQCTSTRVALLTGRFPGRFGPQATQANHTPAIPLGTYTMARMFKEAGYATYLSGKWHLGSTLDHGPSHFAFDSSYGSLTGGVGMYDHHYNSGKYHNSWFRDDAFVHGSDNGVHATDLVVREALRIIESDHPKPYFLYVPFQAPHTPLDERGEFVNQPTRLDPDAPGRWVNEDRIKWFNDPAGIIQREVDPEKRLFLAAVHHMDHAVGQIIAALERSGQRENTLIIFSSDNGPQGSWSGGIYPDDLKLTDFNQPQPFRGMKMEVWEGGIRVPGFINWPGRITPRLVENAVHIVDWLPTLATVIGRELEDSPPLDGIDLTNVIFSDGTLSEREFYFSWYNPFYAYFDKWALIRGPWKIVYYGNGEPRKKEDWELFNLAEDPQERTNVAHHYPQVLAEMHARYLHQRGKDQKAFYQKYD